MKFPEKKNSCFERKGFIVKLIKAEIKENNGIITVSAILGEKATIENQKSLSKIFGLDEDGDILNYESKHLKGEYPDSFQY